MTATEKPSVGDDQPAAWAIVELMGHVKLAGRLSEVGKFGAKMGRLDIPTGDPGCTGVSAIWCPVHGNCVCPVDARGEPISADGGGFGRNGPGCPLHAPGSDHGEVEGEAFVTQLFTGSSVYRITYVSEEVARRVAKGANPQPVQPWEFPRQLRAPEPRPSETCGGHDDDDDVDPTDSYGALRSGGAAAASSW